jgi:sec-independent protein translocase protein TatA
MLAAANVLKPLFGMLAWVPGPWEIAIIVIVVLILFGGKKIPELARGIGKGMREFKREMSGIKRDLDEAADDIQREQPQEERPRRQIPKADSQTPHTSSNRDKSEVEQK